MPNKMLLIIDPQIDFITGALPVAGAESAMNALARYLLTDGADYARIIVTADRHPMRHCSFSTEGGKWPRHCIADSVGAAIWPPLMERLLDRPDREEYSIFKNPSARERILRIIETDNIGRIDICGLAGDICVADSIRDGLDLLPASLFNLLPAFTPSLDGGQTLRSLISLHNLSTTSS